MRAFIASLALILATAATGAPAAAQDQPAPGRRRPPAERRVRRAVPPRAALMRHLRRLDTNRDRQISRDEFKGPAARFDRLDSNHDGALNREDLKALRKKRPGA